MEKRNDYNTFLKAVTAVYPGATSSWDDIVGLFVVTTRDYCGVKIGEGDSHTSAWGDAYKRLPEVASKEIMGVPCHRCNQEPATKYYGKDNTYPSCDHCFDKLNDEFDEEYK